MSATILVGASRSGQSSMDLRYVLTPWKTRRCIYVAEKLDLPAILIVMRTLSVLFFIILSSLAQAQTIEEQIKQQQPSKSDLISKSRSLMLDKLLQNDLNSVSEIKNYIAIKLEDGDYIGLYPVEKILISSLALNPSSALNELQALVLGYSGQASRKIVPPADLLFRKLYDSSRSSRADIAKATRASDLKEEDKDFLELFLDVVLASEEDRDQEKFNSKATAFLGKYPSTVYQNYVREYIRFQYSPSKWAFTFEFMSGYSLNTGMLKEQYRGAIPIGIAFDVYYKNFQLSLRDYIGIGSTREDIDRNGVNWKKGSRTTLFIPELSIGYVIRDSKRLKIAPFVGIASTDLSPTMKAQEQDKELEKLAMTFTTTYTAGLCTDIKLKTPKTKMIAEKEDRYLFLRLRYSMNQPQFEKHYGVSGSIHSFTLGFGGFGRRINRSL